MSVSKIVRSLLTLLSANAIGRALSAITILLIARDLGPAIFGIFSGALAVSQLFSALFSLGLDGWLLRNGGQDENNINGLLGSALLIKLVLGVVWLAIFVPLTSRIELESLPFTAILLAAFCVWLDELNYVIRAGFKAKLSNKVNVILILIDSGVFLLWALVGIVYLDVSPQYFLAGRLVSSILSFCVGAWIFVRRYGIRFDVQRLPDVLHQALPFALSIGLASVYGKADVAIVTHALGGTYTGVYSSAVSLISALFLIPASVYGVLLPALSRVYTHEPESLNRWIRNSMLGIIVLGLGMGVVVFIVARPLSTGLLGEAYVDVGPVLRILSWVLTLRCINFGLGAVIVAVGRQGQRVIAQLISAIFNIVVDLAIIQQANLDLVAGVYVLTEFVLVLGYAYIVIRWSRRSQIDALEHA